MRRSSAFIVAVALGASGAAAETRYPLTIHNCGFTTTIAASPQRVVTIKSAATEMLLALGLGSRIVGRGFEDGPIPERWQADIAHAPILADKLPAQEVVLGVEPDFIYGGWESNFVADGAGERAGLADLGIATYVAPPACRAAPYKPARITFESIFDEITELGVIFDIAPAAEALVGEQRQALASVVPLPGARTALWYSSGTKQPYVGGGTGGPQMTLEALGLTNILADADDTWVSSSWEVVADADPDVIVLVDAAWNSAAQKKELLASNPVTANLSAVINQRYLIIPFPAAEPGVRSVEATVDLAAQLRTLTFD